MVESGHPALRPGLSWFSFGKLLYGGNGDRDYSLWGYEVAGRACLVIISRKHGLADAKRS